MKLIRENRAAVLIILLAAVFLAVGVWQGEMEIVFRKAVNICMECIGLG